MTRDHDLSRAGKTAPPGPASLPSGARPSVPVPPGADPLSSPAFRRGLWQEVKDALFRLPRFLDCVQVEVTSACTGRCVYCPHTTLRDAWRSRSMRAETFAALWPLLLQSRRAHLQGWGEPLLHERFFDFAAFALRAGCRVSTTTCGLRMDEALAGRLVDSGIDVIAFSLAGTDGPSNAARAGVEFDRVVEAIRTLQRVRKARNGVHLEIHLAYLLLADRMQAVVRLPELMEELDVHAAVVSTLDYIAAPGQEAVAFAPPVTPEAREKCRAAAALLAESAARARAAGRDFHYALPGPAPAPRCRENAPRTLYVDADGEVSPCVYLNVPADFPPGHPDARRETFGSVLRGDPVALWQSPAFAAYRARVATDDPPASCLACPKRYERDDGEADSQP